MRRKELLREVWETDHPTDTHLVDVHVANVRRKLREHGEAPWIRTVRGVGFRFDRCSPEASVTPATQGSALQREPLGSRGSRRPARALAQRRPRHRAR